MKTLFPKQRESVDALKNALLRHGGALDSSSTGVGKTVIACRVALEMGRPVIVICPKIVIPHWHRELNETGVSPLLVINYEKLRRGNHYLTKAGAKLYRWNVPPDTLIIWDECHKCKSPSSQNSQMLVAAKRVGLLNLMLSATACGDPTEMRAIGYALGLHSLNKPEGALLSWQTWMLKFGCRKDPWHKWVAGPPNRLKDLNATMYSRNCVKLVPSDLPSAFAENHVIIEPMAFSSLSEIEKFYESHGVTPEIVDMVLDGRAASQEVIVQILRARQLAEVAKVPDIIDMVWDARAEGNSVAIFVNFTDTVRVLHEAFKTGCSVIVGGQGDAEREENVQLFQNNTNKVIVCNIAAGGVGVSLHDTTGERPRVSFISPTFDTKAYIQTLGRIHRAGGKSPATQKILVASGTIEEKVLTILETKRRALETLHAKPEP